MRGVSDVASKRCKGRAIMSFPVTTAAPTPSRLAPARTHRRLVAGLLLAMAWGCQTLDDGEADGGPGSGGGDDGQGTFLPGDDTGPMPDLPCGPSCDSFCDPWGQDCGAGEKCTPYSADGDTTWNGLRCAPVSAEPAGLGEACQAPEGAVAGIDDCGVGLMCWNVDVSGEGVCVGLCTGSPTNAGCLDSLAVCSIYNDGALPICLVECDPLAQNCPGEQLCIPQGGGGSSFVCAVDAAGSEGQYGDPCLAFNKCDPGLFCAPAETVPGCAEAAGCCSEFCDLSDPDPDSACSGQAQGQACLPWFGNSPPPPGLESLGACGIAT